MNPARIGLLLFASGCVCTPLSDYCGPTSAMTCPTEADEISAGLHAAEELWLTAGDCVGTPAVGSTTSGTWVIPSGSGFCGDEYYFDRSGKLLAKRSCCEAECTDLGIGPRIKRGPLTRDLCGEAKRRLRLRGVRLERFYAERVFESDGGAVAPFDAKTWRLPFGAYAADLVDDGGQLSFSFADDRDGGLLISGAHMGPTPWSGQFHYRWRLSRKGASRWVELPLWLEVPDGGSAD